MTELKKNGSPLSLNPSLQPSHAPFNGCTCLHCGKNIRDPVMLADGDSFERTCIEIWLKAGNKTNPVTGEELSHLRLIPNYSLKTFIQSSPAALPSSENLRQAWADQELRIQLHQPGFPLCSSPSAIPDKKRKLPVKKSSAKSYIATINTLTVTSPAQQHSAQCAIHPYPTQTEPKNLFHQGVSHYRLNRDRQALFFLLQAASLPEVHPGVYILLGRIYSRPKSYGVPQDAMKSKLCDQLASRHLNSLQLGAKQGNAEAQYYLALCYFHGIGVIKNPQATISQLTLAAAQGQEDSQHLLALCYQYGHGVEKSLMKALFWYRQLTRARYAAAWHHLADCYEYGEGVVSNMHEAAHYYYLAAKSGHILAQYCLGWCFEKGEGMVKNQPEAVNWYKEAAMLGYAEAQQKLSDCYRLGIGVAKDRRQALYWQQQLASQGAPSEQKASASHVSDMDIKSESETQELDGGICPITGDIMQDPLTTPEGHSFEKEAIEKWLQENLTCPLTRASITLESLIPNSNLKQAINDFHLRNEMIKAIQLQQRLLQNLALCSSPQPDLEKKQLAQHTVPKGLVLPGGAGTFAPAIRLSELTASTLLPLSIPIIPQETEFKPQ